MKQRLVGGGVLGVVSLGLLVWLLTGSSGDERGQSERASEPPFSSQIVPVPVQQPTPGVESVTTQPPLPSAPAAQRVPEAQPAPSLPAPRPSQDASQESSTKQPAVPATPAQQQWVIQLGSFSRSDNAIALRDKLIASGHQAFVDQAGENVRVYVGPISGRDAAIELRETLFVATRLKGVVRQVDKL